MVQLVTVTREGEIIRKVGVAEGPACRHDVGFDRPSGSRRTKGASRQSSEGICPLPLLRGLPAWSSGGSTGGQRRRLLRDVNGTCRACNWMHCEENRPAARPRSLVASEDNNPFIRVDVQRRAILAALRWVDADSAVDENEALAKRSRRRSGALWPWR